jgi:hypothetical protein
VAEESDYERWWQRVWKEREDELQRYFGVSHPPGSPRGYVASFTTCGGELRVLIPGACALVCPPANDGVLVPHRHWIFVGHGLSQPNDSEDRPIPPENFSGYGAEFLVVTKVHQDWAAPLISFLMGYAAKVAPINAGDRVPFGFKRQQDGDVGFFIGRASDHGIEPIHATRALLFWRLLGAPRALTTSTGNVGLLAATAITGDEWRFAKRFGTQHLLLLLMRAGVGQVSAVGRRSALADPAHASLVTEVQAMSLEAADAALEQLSVTNL